MLRLFHLSYHRRLFLEKGRTPGARGVNKKITCSFVLSPPSPCFAINHMALSKENRYTCSRKPNLPGLQKEKCGFRTHQDRHHSVYESTRTFPRVCQIPEQVQRWRYFSTEILRFAFVRLSLVFRKYATIHNNWGFLLVIFPINQIVPGQASISAPSVILFKRLQIEWEWLYLCCIIWL